MTENTVPVLAIDGPSGSGKGTIARAVADVLGWHVLDSGAIYRAVGHAVAAAGIDVADVEAVARCARETRIEFRDPHDGGDIRVIVNGVDATDAIRTETAGTAASAIAGLPAVRAALLDKQLAFRSSPGLVADGRDMGTVIFPGADLKVFLTASAAERAERRHKQLISKGIPAKIADLRADLEARDERDRNRSVAPLKPAEDAMLLDNSALSVQDSMEAVLKAWQHRRPFR